MMPVAEVNIILYLCGVNVSDAIEAFLQYLAGVQRRSLLTVTTYREVLVSFATHLQERSLTEVADISVHDVRDWQMTLVEQGAAPNTMRKRLSALRSWFAFMRRKGWVVHDVMAKVSSPKAPQSLPVFFREKEVQPIYSDALFTDDFEGERDRLLLHILYETGIRRSELVGLTESRVDLNTRTLKVLGKGDKERLIPIEPELTAAIRSYLERKRRIEPYDPHLFVNADGKPVNADKVYTIVRKYMVGLSHANRISPHVFRHTFATQLLNEGAGILAVKELLGHASLNATQIYTHVSREHLKEVYKHAHPRERKGISVTTNHSPSADGNNS